MKWKWYTLRVASIIMLVLPLFGVVTAAVRIMTDRKMLESTEDFLIASFLLCFFLISLLFTVFEWRVTNLLLSRDMADLSSGRRPIIVCLILGGLLLVCWMLAAVSMISNLFLLGIDKARRFDNGFIYAAATCVGMALIMLATYLLTIQALFELKRRRRNVEAAILEGFAAPLRSETP